MGIGFTRLGEGRSPIARLESAEHAAKEEVDR